MMCQCPQCECSNIVEQDIEELSDSALLVKISNRMQLRCQECGWMGYGELLVQAKSDSIVLLNAPLQLSNDEDE
ncbi:MAG TPA: hypothetical protein V6C99_09565 [Oculatellaceae cyanobacterium]